MQRRVPKSVQFLGLSPGFQQRGSSVGDWDCFMPGNRLSTSRTYSHASIPRRGQFDAGWMLGVSLGRSESVDSCAASN